jgi:hypothetical protein
MSLCCSASPLPAVEYQPPKKKERQSTATVDSGSTSCAGAVGVQENASLAIYRQKNVDPSALVAKMVEGRFGSETVDKI